MSTGHSRALISDHVRLRDRGDDVRRACGAQHPFGKVRESLRAAIEALERSGCEAAGYRLSGAGVEHFCVVHLWGRWRLLLGFRDPTVAVIIEVGEHREDDLARDVYHRLYEALAVDPSAEPRDKPPCCDDIGPPVHGAQLEEIEDGYRALTRRRGRR